jgi:hypothetical protein
MPAAQWLRRNSLREQWLRRNVLWTQCLLSNGFAAMPLRRNACGITERCVAILIKIYQNSEVILVFTR